MPNRASTSLQSCLLICSVLLSSHLKHFLFNVVLDVSSSLISLLHLVFSFLFAFLLLCFPPLFFPPFPLVFVLAFFFSSPALAQTCRSHSCHRPPACSAECPRREHTSHSQCLGVAHIHALLPVHNILLLPSALGKVTESAEPENHSPLAKEEMPAGASQGYQYRQGSAPNSRNERVVTSGSRTPRRTSHM